MAGQALTDFVSLGVLASRVPRDAVDEAVEVTGKAARRRSGKLPPHVVVYLVMALALFAEEDYDEVVELLTGALRGWRSWDGRWEPPRRARSPRPGSAWEPMAELFTRVAEPAAGMDTEGTFLGRCRLMSVNGTELEAPDTPANRAAFGAGANGGAFPKVRLLRCWPRRARRRPRAAASSPLPGRCGRGWKRGGCCSPTGCSTTGPPGVPPLIPALTCCGRSRKTSTCRS